MPGQILRVVVRRSADVVLVGASQPWSWSHVLIGSVLNGLLAVVVFTLLDRLKLRA